MAGKLTDYTRNTILNHLFGVTQYTPTANRYVSLYIGDPDSGGIEASGNGYTRKTITFANTTPRKVIQDALITFPQASGSWGGTITHYAIHDSLTNGNILGSGAFSSSFSVVSGNTPKINSGQIELEISTTVSGGGLSNYAVRSLLDLVFSGTSYTQPSIYVAMSSDALVDSDTLTTDFTEISGSGYSRTLVSAFSTSTTSSLSNTSDFSLASPTADDWGILRSLVLMDSSTNGNIIGFNNDDVVDQTPSNGDTIIIPTGNLTVTLN